ncbi:MAG TPA: ABC transporter ATP-binding protein [Candidatus Dormibacteraeota bacterium]|nr:ABC transporter ATP-binding protein [Candidatus Dormibacteraeota bacterium]
MAGVKPGHSLTEVQPLSLLRLESVVKTYRDPMTLRPFTAVDGVSLTLERGEIFGLLGPNGAGKTSTIKMILGLTRPTRGLIRIEGRDPWDPDARRKLGYLPENPCFYDHLNAMEYLELVGSLFGIRAKTRRARAEALLQRLGLSAHARKPLRKFSKGMTQRVGIAQALLNEPNFLVLDEPMSGLDPIGRSDVKQLLREERERGTTILMTSHVLAETESLCDRVAILHAGRVLEVGTVKGLLSSVVEWEIGLESLPADRALALRAQGHRADAVGARWVVRVGSESSLQGILRELVGAGIKIDSVEPRRESLEDHFVRALGASREGRR